MIWMPTLDAAHERAYRGQPGGITILDEQRRLLPAAQEIIRLVAASDAILGLGHISLAEMAALLPAAREGGVRKMVVNHPEINFLDLSPAAQRELAGPGVFFERCYVRANSAVDWDGFAAGIRALGVETTVLATDLGQPDNPDPISGMQEMLAQLARRDFTQRELETMSCKNPATLLGLSHA